MKLSEYKDEQAIDLLADIIEPATEIMADAEVKKMFKEKASKVAAIKYAIKNHKSAVMEILAALDGVPVEEYHCNVFTLPMKCLEILSDEDLISFFTSAAQTMEVKPSGSPTESIVGENQ